MKFRKPFPPWVKGLEKLVAYQGRNLGHYELVGPHKADSGSAKGKAIAGQMPKSVQAFFEQQLNAARDNDGSPALLRFPLKEISPKLHGAAIAVRWTSEDQTADRLFVFDPEGKPVAKVWTDKTTNYDWEPAGGPFEIDDTPHS